MALYCGRHLWRFSIKLWMPCPEILHDNVFVRTPLSTDTKKLHTVGVIAIDSPSPKVSNEPLFVETSLSIGFISASSIVSRCAARDNLEQCSCIDMRQVLRSCVILGCCLQTRLSCATRNTHSRRSYVEFVYLQKRSLRYTIQPRYKEEI